MGDTGIDNINTCLNILKTSSVPDTKIEILEFLLGLTGTNDGLETLYNNAETLVNILLQLTFSDNVIIAKSSCSALVNISAEEKGAKLLISEKLNVENGRRNHICKRNKNEIVLVLMDHVVNPGSTVTNQVSVILANMSRNSDIARIIYDCFENGTSSVETITRYLVNKNENYDNLALFLSNLSQLPEVRSILLNTENILRRLVPLIGYEDSVVRRTGVIGTLRNLCFSSDNHELLLNSDLEFLSNVLLPLAGPEEFDDEDTEKLPLDLQYLSYDKIREPDRNLRHMLLEILMQLSATQFSRNFMRRFNVYIILREYHKWENDAQCLTTCEDLVNILIRTEDEIGVDNLQNVDVPQNFTDKLNKFV